MSGPLPARRGGRTDAVLGVVWLLGTVALATVLAWPVWQSGRLLVVSTVGVLVGAGVVLLGRARRWGAGRTAAVVAGAYLVVAVPVAVPWRATLGGWPLGLLDALAGPVVGWKQLLTLELPLQEYQAVLVPWLVAVVVTTALAAPLVVRSDARAAWAVPVVVPLVLLGPAFGAVTPSASRALGPVVLPDARTTVVFVVVVAWAVAWSVARALVARRRALRLGSGAGARRRRAGVAHAAGRAVAAAALVGVAVLVAAAVAPAAVGWSQRHVLREDVAPVLAVQREVSPLTAYRAAFRTVAFDQELFTVEDAQGVDRLRVAVLDAYDGATFEVGTAGEARFLRLARSSAPGASATVEVAVGPGWSGIWVPVPSGVAAAPRFGGERADALAAGFYVAADDGSAVVVTDDGGLRAGDTYTVVAAPRALGPDALGAPGAVDADAFAEQWPQLDAWVQAQEQAATPSGLVTLVDRLRARSYLSHAVAADADADAWVSALQDQGEYAFQSSYAGHSRARVEEIFAELVEQQEAVGERADDDALVAAVGDGEQLAAAVAVLARSLGYESRVVVGVRLTDVPGASVPACTQVCRGQHLATWVEVRSPGGPWVTLDVDPQVEQAPVLVEQGARTPQNPTLVEPPELPVVEPPVVAGDSTATTQEQDEDEISFGEGRWVAVLRTVGLVAGGLGLLLAPLLVLPAAKAVRRRRRRRAPVPEVAAVGAWDELVDRALDLGTPLDGPSRAAAAAASGRPGVVALAAVVDRAVFSSAPAGPDDADEAWALHDAEVETLRAAVSPWRRLRAALAGTSVRAALRAPRPDRSGALAVDPTPQEALS